jgi:hypothetical protein
MEIYGYAHEFHTLMSALLPLKKYPADIDIDLMSLWRNSKDLLPTLLYNLVHTRPMYVFFHSISNGSTRYIKMNFS